MRYTADELARLTGVSPRTVRFYVAERLISPPLGKGRGAHFDARHLSELRRVRLLQAAGLDNRSIRDHAEELGRILQERGMRLEDAEHAWGSFARQAAEAWNGLKRPPLAPVEVSHTVRVTIAPGLELLVGDAYRLPGPAPLAELASTVKAAFVTRGGRASARADPADDSGEEARPDE